VLFDGTNMDNWTGKGEIDARKLMCTQHGNALTKKKYQNFILHVDIWNRSKPYGREQDRGNSGVYLQNRYEVQVLDSFGRTGQEQRSRRHLHEGCAEGKHGLPAAIVADLRHRFHCREIRGRQEGQERQRHRQAQRRVDPRKPGNHRFDRRRPEETPEPGEIQLQGHGNPVFFKYLWIAEKK